MDAHKDSGQWTLSSNLKLPLNPDNTLYTGGTDCSGFGNTFDTCGTGRSLDNEELDYIRHLDGNFVFG